MIVLKFGGTSVADAERMRQAARILLGQAGESVVVVVSAMAGVTNELLRVAERAAAGDPARAAALVASLASRHAEVLREVAGEGSEATERQFQQRELERLEEVLRSRDPEQAKVRRDAVASVGEVLSHRLMTAAIRSEGGAAEAVDPRLLFPTDASFGAAQVDRKLLIDRCRELVLPHLQAGRVVVTGGFVGATAAGVPTTLGRGGSDLSATLLGAAMGATSVEIWTDVDGFLTADPRVVEQARLLPQLSYAVAAELAFFGARVLHPATLQPAMERGIPVSIRNSFRPEAPGTRIGTLTEEPPRGVVRAVAWKEGIATVAVSSERMIGTHGFLARLFEVFDRFRTSVDVVTTSEASVSMTVERVDQLDAIERELRPLGRVRVERDMALVCLVGHSLLEHPARVGEVLATLAGIPLRMFCLGSSDINLTLVVHAELAREVVRRLHAAFLEGHRDGPERVQLQEAGR